MFAVRWSPSAAADLAAITMLHPARWAEIDDAGEEIDEKLNLDPINNGTHVSEGLWRIIAKPLVAFYVMEGATSSFPPLPG